MALNDRDEEFGYPPNKHCKTPKTLDQRQRLIPWHRCRLCKSAIYLEYDQALCRHVIVGLLVQVGRRRCIVFDLLGTQRLRILY